MEGHRMTNEIADRAGKTERILYLDCLRIISIAAMMLLHISAQNWSSLDLHDPAWMHPEWSDAVVRSGFPDDKRCAVFEFPSPNQ